MTDKAKPRLQFLARNRDAHWAFFDPYIASSCMCYIKVSIRVKTIQVRILLMRITYGSRTTSYKWTLNRHGLKDTQI